MNKEEKIKKLRDFSDYIDSGIVEVGRENNITVDVVNILKVRTGKMPDSVFVLQNFARMVCLRKNYSSATFRVLFYFIAVTGYENFVSVDVKTIAENLDLSVESVKRSTKQLVDDNVLIKIPHPIDKRRWDYFINPESMWKGKSVNRQRALDKSKKAKIQLDMFA
jgi:hypothetical protein